MIRLARLDARAPDRFPDPALALTDPNGLLAFGGDLSPRRLLAAYAQGIFPWYSEGDPLLWWSPDPRCVFATDAVHVSRSLAKALRHCDWQWTMDHAFEAVVQACAGPRDGQDGTWITPDMLVAYAELHRMGSAHSLEILHHGELVGGIYGIAVGRMFSAESMFSRRSNASKAALVALARVLHARGFPMIDAQVPNPHLRRMGASLIPRSAYLDALARLARLPNEGSWPQSLAPVAALMDPEGPSS